jgi:hypothetical protein
VEGQLKLLYTAATRARSRLLFVETRPSRAGAAFFRWLRETGLGEPLAPAAAAGGEEGLATGDELRAQGADLALAAGAGQSAVGASLLRKAALCFRRAGRGVGGSGCGGVGGAAAATMVRCLQGFGVG